MDAMDKGFLLLYLEINRTGAESCPIRGFGISSVKTVLLLRN
jgi:hypothetical protein